MSLLEAILLGLVQGLTEFLPISSTAHMRIVPVLLNMLDANDPWVDPGAAASAIIQLGTLGAILIYFRRDLVTLALAFVRALWQGRPFETLEARLTWYIAGGTLPVVVCGLAFEGFITSGARSLWVIATALIGLALVLYLAERVSTRHRSLKEVTWRDALLVGLAQAVALIPGASRSGTTITGGLFLGMRREAAARFSFLLSIPAVAGSGLYELYEIRHTLSMDLAWNLVLATSVALLSGYGAIAFLLNYLRTHTTYVFVWYRVGVGLVLVVFLLNGMLH